MEILKDVDLAIAKHAINTFMTKHGQTNHLPPNSLYVTDDIEDFDLRINVDESATHTTFRLKTQEEDADEAREVTFYTVGVLTQKLLPPFKPKRKYYSGRDVLFRTFRQSVSLLDAGAGVIDKAVQCAKVGFVLLNREAAKASSFPSERICGENFVVANPYFEIGDDAKGKPRVPFPKLVDPFDDLNRVQSDRCVHTPDNVVQFLEGYENEAGLFRQSPVTPARFRPGDIVRVGFAICMRQENAHNNTSSDLLLVLRSITLIDDALSTELSLKELEQPADQGKKRSNITHNSLSEDVDEHPMYKVRKAMSKLSIHGSDMDVDKNAKVASGSSVVQE
ncbi:hypothetical protein K523DRAFT_334129 [Schizophyllum commune Tattone D]|nr:hypothetical protein K523DRAFT_334129 [Schizophyllum commune Tattone D]